MQVMKFGGASVKDAAGIRNVAEIIRLHLGSPCLIVVSAMDKTTNHLESLAFLARDNREAEAKAQFQRIRDFHASQVAELFGAEAQAGVLQRIAPYFSEMERMVTGILMLEEFPARIYDRIVAYGELLSTVIVAEYAAYAGMDSLWLDAREIVKTDANWKQAGVIWTLTEENIRLRVRPQLKAGRAVFVQGFIGSTPDGHTTTLGREGSDYTGSIFAHCLDAESLTVWKDVPGILNGDPRIRAQTVKLDKLSYEEAVEMTFYGASVIHPKTIKPLHNKGIPLRVKCFLDPSLEGSVISHETQQERVSSYIVKKAQSLLRITPRDFSFMEERLMQEVFDYIYKCNVKVNLVQQSAISLMLCVDSREAENSDLLSLLMDKFQVEKQDGLELSTILNFTEADLAGGEGALLRQQQGSKLFLVR
jgi:aspartate kinase